MNVASIKTHAYLLTNTSSTTFLGGDSNVLAPLNVAYGHRILDILRVSVDKNASLNEAKTHLVSITGLSEGTNGYEGEYAFPTDLLKPIRMEVSFDGTNWYPCDIYDLTENHTSEVQQSIIDAKFSTTNPFVRFERDSFFIRPLPTTSVTNGIRIWYEQRQTDLTTDSPTFEQNLHDILAYDLAELEYIKHAESYTPTQYQRFLQKKTEVEQRFFDFYKSRFKRNFRMKQRYESYK